MLAWYHRCEWRAACFTSLRVVDIGASPASVWTDLVGQSRALRELIVTGSDVSVNAIVNLFARRHWHRVSVAWRIDYGKQHSDLAGGKRGPVEQ